MANLHASVVLLIVLAVIGCVFASPIQFQEESGTLRQDAYQPYEYLGRYFDDRGNSFEPRIFSVGGRFSRQTRRGLDSLSGATFGESKRFPAPSFAKRNIDEIDRTAFDSFFKRNFDEIDRDGWDGFVKRLSDYLANRKRR